MDLIFFFEFLLYKYEPIDTKKKTPKLLGLYFETIITNAMTNHEEGFFGSLSLLGSDFLVLLLFAQSQLY